MKEEEEEEVTRSSSNSQEKSLQVAVNRHTQGVEFKENREGKTKKKRIGARDEHHNMFHVMISFLDTFCLKYHQHLFTLSWMIHKDDFFFDAFFTLSLPMF